MECPVMNIRVSLGWYVMEELGLIVGLTFKALLVQQSMLQKVGQSHKSKDLPKTRAMLALD
jgi:hypothetical protein